MPPNTTDDVPYLGTTGFKKPVTGISYKRKNGDLWLDGKRIDDGAEGLWRIHNRLYDLNNFVQNHPGGSQWLELTKGTDITEAFEVHHIRSNPEKLLPKFYVRDAKTSRISPYTFKDDGFYRTLKRNVQKELENVPKRAIFRSGVYTDLLLIATFIFSILACKWWNYWFCLPAGYFLASLTVAAHNYFHQRDNFRMYYFNFSTLNYREWRISHSLSHHLYTNTIVDLEILLLQPFAQYLPIEKGLCVKYASIVYSPFLWVLFWHIAFINRLATAMETRDNRSFSKADLIPYILPLTMYLFSDQSILHAFAMWNLIIMSASFTFTFVGINAAHHHPDIFHDGDTPRKDTDWGLRQLDAVADRNEISGSHYLVLTNFGDHALHHMFPTLDQGLLEHIYPAFKKTLKEFKVEMHTTSQLELIKGQFQQLARTEPNLNEPSAFWKSI